MGDAAGLETSPPPHAVHEVRALGLRFHPVRKTTLLDLIFTPREAGEQVIIGGANLHGLYVYERNADYRALLDHEDTLVIVDGMPVIWGLRLLGHDVSREQRTTWVDWFSDMLARAEAEGRSVFILGHAQEVLDAGLAKARTAWPKLRLGGAHGYFGLDDAPACERVLSAIDRFQPDILIIGMGMPRQEAFVQRFRSRLKAPVIGLGGAAFAYFAGFEPTPPRWMGRMGLEWLHRLAANPKRLVYRYLVEPLPLAVMLIRRGLLSRRSLR